jgi:hypothetical protein
LLPQRLDLEPQLIQSQVNLPRGAGWAEEALRYPGQIPSMLQVQMLEVLLFDFTCRP